MLMSVYYPSPQVVYNGVSGGDVEAVVKKYCTGEVATFSAQESAWFDDRVMMKWIEVLEARCL
ncbi:hypothetical protein PC116_g13614 [Phytophthora cactorum]|nr:hypothetical protein PC120_g12475 [Phytophthora cactorum]KAG3192578.1 hypothetical protein PC128_g10473 [Phytophthora cactorum]KAG4238340.1 hypothetical protein PC116_g13614 [Phytophthora cactorum]